MRKVVIPSKELLEKIHAFTVDTENERVTVATGLGSVVNGKFVFEVNQSFNTVAIAAEDYQELMDQDGGPEKLVPGKPKGTFRADDLWPFIDRINSRKKTEGGL